MGYEMRAYETKDKRYFPFIVFNKGMRFCITRQRERITEEYPGVEDVILYISCGYRRIPPLRALLVMGDYIL